MIIPDVNLLLHAHDSEFRRHRAARAWWESLMNGTGSVGLPWVSILGFIRIATRRCCTNWFGRGLALRRLSLLSDDSAGLRLAQLGHPVQYVTPHHRLSLLRFVGARPKAVSEHALIPQEEILDAGLSAIP